MEAVKPTEIVMLVLICFHSLLWADAIIPVMFTNKFYFHWRVSHYEVLHIITRTEPDLDFLGLSCVHCVLWTVHSLVDLIFYVSPNYFRAIALERFIFFKLSSDTNHQHLWHNGTIVWAQFRPSTFIFTIHVQQHKKNRTMWRKIYLQFISCLISLFSLINNWILTLIIKKNYSLPNFIWIFRFNIPMK